MIPSGMLITFGHDPNELTLDRRPRVYLSRSEGRATSNWGAGGLNTTAVGSISSGIRNQTHPRARSPPFRTRALMRGSSPKTTPAGYSIASASRKRTLPRKKLSPWSASFSISYQGSNTFCTRLWTHGGLKTTWIVGVVEFQNSERPSNTGYTPDLPCCRGSGLGHRSSYLRGINEPANQRDRRTGHGKDSPTRGRCPVCMHFQADLLLPWYASRR